MNTNKTLAIGDIHGCIDSLDSLLTKIPDQVDTFIFLGDLIDRGPDSKAVVNRIIELQKTFPKVIPLAGNHECMFRQYLHGVNRSFFLSYGGRETLASYNIGQQEKNPLVLLPKDHIDFFNSLPLYWEDSHGIYVHAGLQPGIHLTLQSPEWCLWAREEFVNSGFDFGKKVIFGHTVFTAPLVQENKIGVDTGAVYGGTLTGLVLPDIEFITVPGLS